MSFLATANPPTKAQEPVVKNDGWWPDIDPAHARAACRFDGTVTAERFAYALATAMASVNDELQAWREEQQARWGYESLQDVPSNSVGRVSAKVVHYQRAVYECMQADVEEAFRNMAQLPSGLGKAARVETDLALNVDTHRRNQRWAISDLLGKRRTTVELI